jgi:hypothetical protein
MTARTSSAVLSADIASLYRARPGVFDCVDVPELGYLAVANTCGRCTCVVV